MKTMLVLFSCVALTGCSPESFGLRFSQPGMEGVVVDKQTGEPLGGAFVYGFYAIETGTVAGGTGSRTYVHHFAAKTDTRGRYKLRGWGSSDWFTRGTSTNEFPVLQVYKPGYRVVVKNLQTLSDWVPNDKAYALSSPPRKNLFTTIDWTKYPVELETSESSDLSDVGLGIGYGDCAWETYADLIRVLHDETMKWNMAYATDAERVGAQRELAPVSDIGRPGLPTTPPPRRSWKQQLIAEYDLASSRNQQSTWKCANPRQVFNVKEN